MVDVEGVGGVGMVGMLLQCRVFYLASNGEWWSSDDPGYSRGVWMQVMVMVV